MCGARAPIDAVARRFIDTHKQIHSPQSRRGRATGPRSEVMGSNASNCPSNFTVPGRHRRVIAAILTLSKSSSCAAASSANAKLLRASIENRSNCFCAAVQLSHRWHPRSKSSRGGCCVQNHILHRRLPASAPHRSPKIGRARIRTYYYPRFHCHGHISFPDSHLDYCIR